MGVRREDRCTYDGCKRMIRIRDVRLCAWHWLLVRQ